MSNPAKLEWPFQLRQLAVMVDSGMPVDTSMKSLALRSNSDTAKLKKAHRLVKRGVSLPSAFHRAGLVKEFDYAMLKTADAAGRLADGLNHISERQISQLQRVGSFRVGLIFPKLLVIIGALAAVFIRMAAGVQPVDDIIFSIAFVVGWFYLLTHASMVAVRADSRIWMSWFWPYSSLHKASPWYSLALEYFFYNSFLWQVSSGVPFSTAVRNCSSLFSSPQFQLSTASASESMDRGGSISNSLLANGLVQTDRMRQVLLIADQSGKHESAIRHELSIQRETLKQKADDFFKWMPRVFYVIALVVVSKLLVS